MGSLPSLTRHIRKMIDNMVPSNKPKMRRGGIIELEESPRVSVESDSTLNVRVHRVANGWVVNKTIEADGSYESETHVCGVNDNVVDKVTELVAMYKLNA
jgi:hypothetical protein